MAKNYSRDQILWIVWISQKAGETKSEQSAWRQGSEETRVLGEQTLELKLGQFVSDVTFTVGFTSKVATTFSKRLILRLLRNVHVRPPA